MYKLLRTVPDIYTIIMLLILLLALLMATNSELSLLHKWVILRGIADK